MYTYFIKPLVTYISKHRAHATKKIYFCFYIFRCVVLLCANCCGLLKLERHGFGTLHCVPGVLEGWRLLLPLLPVLVSLVSRVSRSLVSRRFALGFLVVSRSWILDQARCLIRFARRVWSGRGRVLVGSGRVVVGSWSGPGRVGIARFLALYCWATIVEPTPVENQGVFMCFQLYSTRIRLENAL
jgi:hypothetical protein